MIPEDGIVFGAHEVSDAIAMLLLPARHGQHAMHARVELLAGEEAEHVADINDGVTWPRLHVMPTSREQGLKAPLLGEEKGQGARIGMFVHA